MGSFSLIWGIWSVGINFCSEFPRSIYILSKDIGTPNYYLLGLFQTSAFGLGDLVFKVPLSFHGLPQKSSVGISEEDICIGHRKLTPDAFFSNAFLYSEHPLSGGIGHWVSGLPEFLVHVHQIISGDVGLLMCLDIS